MKHSTVSVDVFHSILTGALSKLGPLGLSLSGHIRSGGRAIVNAPMPDPSSISFVKDYAAYSLLRKYEGFISDPSVTRNTAIEKWLVSEDKCRERNAMSDSERNARASLLFVTQRKISEILGVFSYDEFLQVVDHSGGASTQRRRSTAAIENKESDNHNVTIGAYKLLQLVNREFKYYATPTIRNFSKFATVPKDAKTDRPIIIENQGNMFLQKGIGTMIRTRLKKFGIDLNDQTRNQTLCSDLENATIDLSSASDSIASSLVLDLLPAPWADIIFATRSPYVLIDDRIHELEKIGGMGNGFVFELESLIFYCICKSAIELSLEYGPIKNNFVSVYGDDIIVDVSHAQVCIEALTSFGFEINTLKSFWSGPFRESCGKHYHNTADCTPVYIKRYDNTVGSWYHLYNSLSSLSHRIGVDFSRELNRIEGVLTSVGACNWVPPSFGLRAGLHSHTPYGALRSKYPKSIQGYRFTVYRESTKEYKVCQLGAYLSTLRRISRRTDPSCTLIVQRSGLRVIPPILELSEGFIKRPGKRFNTRVGLNKGPGKFHVVEQSWWLL